MERTVLLSHRTLAPLLAVAILAFAPQNLQAIEKKWTESVPTRAGFQLSVNHGDGDVIVRSWEQDRIEVEVIYSAADPGPGQNLEVTFNSDPLNLTIMAWEDDSSDKRRSPDDQYLIEIYSPTYVSIRSSGDDGDLVIGDWHAPIDSRFDDGNLLIGSLDGSLKNYSDDGNVTVGSLRGDVDLQTRDGNIELPDLVAGTVNIRALDGDVELGLTTSPSLVEVTADDGSIDVELAEGVELGFELATVEGWIEVFHPDRDRFTLKRRAASGKIGGGSSSMRLTTTTGDVTLRQVDPAQ